MIRTYRDTDIVRVSDAWDNCNLSTVARYLSASEYGALDSLCEALLKRDSYQVTMNDLAATLETLFCSCRQHYPCEIAC